MTDGTGLFTSDGGFAAPYQKVTAFVTRQSGRGRELLVFRHPTAGVQLPAGSVEPGEAVEAAALREVAEETGLRGIAVVASLGSRTYDLPDEGRVVARETFLRLHSGENDQGFPVRRGLTAHEIGQTDGYSQVELREYILRDGVLQIDRVVASGWVLSQDLSAAVERHFFHLGATAPTPAEWTWLAEGEHDFQCYWVPLSDDPGLVVGQDSWLAWFADDLRRE